MRRASERDGAAWAAKEAAKALDDGPAHANKVAPVLVDRDKVDDHEHHTSELAYTADGLDRLRVHRQGA